MRDTYAAITKARHDLEHHSIEGSSTAQAVTFITFVQDLKRKVIKWTPEISIFATGQQTLERQRYQFPGEWLYVDQVQGEWSAFNEILKRKNDSIQQQLGVLFSLLPASAVLRATDDWPLPHSSRPPAQDCRRGQDCRSED